MTNEQLRIALTANAVTKQTRNHFGFSDPCGKTLEEYKRENERLRMENELLRDFLRSAGRR